jgi:hypothetical protein
MRFRHFRILVIAALASAALFLPGRAVAVPSFSRQTGRSCSACHTQFPELNAFGRAFKIGGYTLADSPLNEDKDIRKKEVLSLPQVPLVSTMFLASYTSLDKRLPSDAGPTMNGDVLFPDQLSLFLAGRIASQVGAFIQVTYDSQEGSVALDNTDIRFVGTPGGKVAWGFTLNNNPTVQDVWNSTPAWGFPWNSSSVAPGPAAATMIEGALGQQVAGLGGYVLWNDRLYGEVTVYRASPQGVARPLDGTSGAVVDGVAPYWRFAYQRDNASHSFSVGTLGMQTKIFPGAPLDGPTDKFTDWGLDAQYQWAHGDGGLSAHALWIDEKQDLGATFAKEGSANSSVKLQTFKVDTQYRFSQRWALSAGVFSVKGDGDAVLYGANREGKPDSLGYLVRGDYQPWQNVKFTLMYTAYSKFNGGGSDYDMAGRNASNNNSIYASAWLVF